MHGFPLSAVANALTASRLAISPVVYSLCAAGSPYFAPALALVATGGLTDALDGALARRASGRPSQLGKLLDPIADKSLLSASVLGLTSSNSLSFPLAATVISRDALLLSGCAFHCFMSQSGWRDLPGPSLLGKTATATQLTAALSALSSGVFGFPSAQHHLAVELATGSACVASLVLYGMRHRSMFILVQRDRTK